MFNSVDVVLMLLSMFSSVSMENRNVVLFLLELIFQYDMSVGRFPMTRRTYEGVCQLYEPLSALGAYHESIIEDKSQPTFIGAYALLRAILMPILAKLSAEELEELHLSADDGVSLLFLPLPKLQAAVKRWTRQARKDDRFANWTGISDDGILDFINPNSQTATMISTAQPAPATWPEPAATVQVAPYKPQPKSMSGVSMDNRFASAVLEYCSEYAQLDYAATPTRVELVRRRRVDRRKVEDPFDDSNNNTGNNLKAPPEREAWWTSSGTSCDLRQNLNTTKARPKEPEDTTSVDGSYSMETPVTPLKRLASFQTFDDILYAPGALWMVTNDGVTLGNDIQSREFYANQTSAAPSHEWNNSEQDSPDPSGSDLEHQWYGQYEQDAASICMVPTPLNHNSSAPTVESSLRSTMEEPKYSEPLASSGAPSQLDNFVTTDANVGNNLVMSETPLKRSSFSGFDYRMWDMVPNGFQDIQESTTLSSLGISQLRLNSEVSWSALGLAIRSAPPTLRRKAGVRDLRAASTHEEHVFHLDTPSAEDVFIGGPSANTTATGSSHYSLNPIINLDSDSDESMGENEAIEFPNGPASPDLTRDTWWISSGTRIATPTPVSDSVHPNEDHWQLHYSSLQDLGVPDSRADQLISDDQDTSDEEEQAQGGWGSDVDMGEFELVGPHRLKSPLAGWVFPRMRAGHAVCDELELGSMVSSGAPSLAYSSRGTSPILNTPRTSAAHLSFFDNWATEWERNQHSLWVSALREGDGADGKLCDENLKSEAGGCEEVAESQSAVRKLGSFMRRKLGTLFVQ